MLYEQDLIKSISEELNERLSEVKTTGKKYTMVVSKETIDRDGDIISIDGIDLKYYKKNPVVLIDHKYNVESIVGKCTNIRKKNDELVADIEFADTEKGRLCQKLRDDGFLNASSIGFMKAERDSGDVKKIVKCEMLEFSMVAIGSNRDALKVDGKVIDEETFEKALSLGVIKGEEEKDDTGCGCGCLKKEISEIKELLQSMVDSKTVVQEEEELKEKKKLIQQINNSFSNSLRLIKHL